MRHLLEEFVPHVFRFAVRLTGDPHEAEDLTQDVLLRAWRGSGRLRDPKTLRVWLFRITVNLWTDLLRRRKRTPHIEHLTDNEPDQHVDSPAMEIVRNEEMARAMETLDALPARQRDVVYLHVCEDLRLNDIASVLGISYEAAKASLSMGRKRMRKELKDLFHETSGVVKKGD